MSAELTQGVVRLKFYRVISWIFRSREQETGIAGIFPISKRFDSSLDSRDTFKIRSHDVDTQQHNVISTSIRRGDIKVTLLWRYAITETSKRLYLYDIVVLHGRTRWYLKIYSRNYVLSQRTTKPTKRLVRPGNTDQPAHSRSQICLRWLHVPSRTSIRAIQRGMNENFSHTGWMYRLICWSHRSYCRSCRALARISEENVCFLTNASSKTPGPEVIKLFSCSLQLSMNFVLLINLKLLTIVNSFLLNIAEQDIFSANKYENANFSYLFSRKKIVLSWDQHEKSFITSRANQSAKPPDSAGPDQAFAVHMFPEGAFLPGEAQSKE